MGIRDAIAGLIDAEDAPATLRFPLRIGQMAWHGGIPADIERLGEAAGLESTIALARGGFLVADVTVTARGPADRLISFLRAVAFHFNV